MTTLIALLLILSIADSLVSLSTVNAAVNNYNSFVYVSANTDVIGVGQQILLVMWTADMPPDIGEQAGANRWRQSSLVWYKNGCYKA